MTRNEAGEVLTVRYEQLVPLLLKELQQQLNEEQGRQIQEQRRRNEALEARLAKLEGK